MSRNYRLIVAPRKFDVLNTNICPRSEASRANMLVLRTSNFQGATIRAISSETKALYCLYCSPLNFPPRASSKINQTSIELFSTFLDESGESQMKNLNRKTDKTHFIQFQLVFFFYKPACLQMNFHGRLLSIQVFSADGHYLNNRVFLSRNYRLIVAPRKFDVLKTNICPRSEASRANMLVLRTSNFQGATIRPIVPRQKHSIVFIVHH